MDLKTEALETLKGTLRFFERSIRCLEEEHSGFRATPDTMTVAEQVAHVAHTADWFREGVFQNQWDMDFESQMSKLSQVKSLAAARSELQAAWGRMVAVVESSSVEHLAAVMPDNPILPGLPRVHAVSALVDHSAHHRGALAVYARLLGRVPEMPYADE